MTKKRGGQPNNRNAFKHGFYTKHFIEVEKRTLEEIPLSDLTPEIDLMRVSIERFMEVYTASLPQLDYEKRLAGLRAITIAAGRIASLERIQACVSVHAEEARKIQEEIMNSNLNDDTANEPQAQ